MPYYREDKTMPNPAPLQDISKILTCPHNILCRHRQSLATTKWHICDKSVEFCMIIHVPFSCFAPYLQKPDITHTFYSRIITHHIFLIVTHQCSLQKHADLPPSTNLKTPFNIMEVSAWELYRDYILSSLK